MRHSSIYNDEQSCFNAFATDYLAKNQPSDQEIFDTYQEQVVLAPTQEFKARHILVDAQGAAVSLIEQLQGGADFATLAKEHSTGPTGPMGGDLGWFPSKWNGQAFCRCTRRDGRRRVFQGTGTNAIWLACHPSRGHA